MKAWDHIIVEAYCGINIGKGLKGDKYHYQLKEDSLKSVGDLKFKKVLNPDYDPNFKPEKLPKFCEFKKKTECVPSNNCLFNDCPFLSLCEVPSKHEEVFLRAWDLLVCDEKLFADRRKKFMELVDSEREKDINS